MQDRSSSAGAIGGADGMEIGRRAAHTIVVVDDDPIWRVVIEGLLVATGRDAHFAAAADAASGAELCATLLPDLVLMDIFGVGEDGLDAAIRIGEQPGMEHATIVATTASTDRSIHRRVADAGLPLIVKPMSLEDLERLLVVSKRPVEKMSA